MHIDQKDTTYKVQNQRTMFMYTSYIWFLSQRCLRPIYLFPLWDCALRYLLLVTRFTLYKGLGQKIYLQDGLLILMITRCYNHLSSLHRLLHVIKLFVPKFHLLKQFPSHPLIIVLSTRFPQTLQGYSQYYFLLKFFIHPLYYRFTMLLFKKRGAHHSLLESIKFYCAHKIEVRNKSIIFKET